MANHNKLAFLSQDPVDKVVYAKTSSVAVGGFNNTTFDPGTGAITFTHNLNRRCFPEVTWSTDNVNFREAPAEDGNRVGVVAKCDLNTVTVYAYQSLGTTAKTVFFTVYLLWPS